MSVTASNNITSCGCDNNSTFPGPAFNQNNVARWEYFGYILDEGLDIATANVADHINGLSAPIEISEIQTPVMFEFRRSVVGGNLRYLFLFTRGKGRWGGLGATNPGALVNAWDVKRFPVVPVTIDDIGNGDNTVIISLEDVGVGGFLDSANAEERDLSDGSKFYYFSYEESGVFYTVRFIGTPGEYGGSFASQLTAEHFIAEADSNTSPIPTLEQVNAGGEGTTNPLTVLGIDGKLSVEHDRLVFTNSEGDATEYHTNPDTSQPENKIAKMEAVLPRKGTMSGYPLKGLFEIDGSDTEPFYLRKVTPGVTTQYLAIADGIVNLSCFYPTGLGVLFDITPEGISFQSTTGGSMGLSSPQNFSPYLTANSYVQKNYVDNAVANLFFKTECLVATTSNITLSGLQTIDGVSLTYGDRVLVKKQSAALQNGIYEVTSGLWQRTQDADTGAKLANKTIPITRGTVNQDTWWTVTNDSITINVTDIHFTQTGGMGTYMNGTGLLLAGNVFALDSSYVNGLISAAFASAHVSRVLKCDLTDSSTLTGSTTETVLGSFLIPAGSGDMDLSILAKLQKTGSGGTSDIRLRLHTSVAVGGSQIALFTTTAAHRYIPFSREFSLKSGVLFGFASANSTLADTSTGSNPVSLSYNPAVDNYIIITGTLVNASDSLVQKSLRATYFKPV